MDEKLDSKHWPCWRYHADHPPKIFYHPDDVPKGWVDTPAKLGQPETENPKPNGTERDVELLGGNIFQEDIEPPAIEPEKPEPVKRKGWPKGRSRK